MSRWIVALTALAAAVGCSRPAVEAKPGVAAPTNPHAVTLAREATAPVIQFEDWTQQAGIDFTHVSGNSPDKHFPAANGAGLAMFDFDSDGWQDLYFVTARRLPFSPGEPGPVNKLFRNRWPEMWDEVGTAAGLDLALFAHGVTCGDLDNDGCVDLVLTTYGGTRIYRNAGDGTFQPWPGFYDERWGASAACLDYDGDGALDVYVCHYGHWSIEKNEFCGDPVRQIRTFCSPKRIPPAVHALYRNSGAGGFRDVTQEVGIAREDGRGQGVVAADLNEDGLIDLYVANDLSPNFLFLNAGKGQFRDMTDYSGAAFSRDGVSQAGMGVDAADIDRDGRADLYVTNFSREYNAYYMNLGEGTFLDKSHPAGLAGDSMDEVGWGTRLVDLDNDGWLDVFVTNGHVDDNVAELTPGTTYAQKPKLWRNEQGRFRLQPAAAGFFEQWHVARGAAFGDFDNDGRLDVAINHVDSPAALLRNTSPVDPDSPTPFVRFELVGTVSNRDGVGTKVSLTGDGLPGTFVQQLNGGGSYESAHDLRLLVGIGKVSRISEARIRWPSGRETALGNIAPGRECRLVEPIAP